MIGAWEGCEVEGVPCGVYVFSGVVVGFLLFLDSLQIQGVCYPSSDVHCLARGGVLEYGFP